MGIEIGTEVGEYPASFADLNPSVNRRGVGTDNTAEIALSLDGGGVAAAHGGVSRPTRPKVGAAVSEGPPLCHAAVKSSDGRALTAWLPRLWHQVLAGRFIGRILHRN